MKTVVVALAVVAYIGALLLFESVNSDPIQILSSDGPGNVKLVLYLNNILIIVCNIIFIGLKMSVQLLVHNELFPYFLCCELNK